MPCVIATLVSAFTNLCGGEIVARLCRGVCANHVHVRAWGTVKDHNGVWVNRASAAGRYPLALCKVLADIVLVNYRDYIKR